MILYLDTSALIKRYVAEAGSAEVTALVEQASHAGSVVLARVEMAAAFSKAARMEWVDAVEAEHAWEDFLSHWSSFTRITISPALIERASKLAWDQRLRGYEAAHLAAALLWQEVIDTPLTLATFDRELWQAARKSGLDAWPERLG